MSQKSVIRYLTDLSDTEWEAVAPIVAQSFR